jgi:hypothetical protein
VFTAGLVIVLLTLNRLPGYDPSPSQVISEYIGLAAAVVLLAQVRLSSSRLLMHSFCMRHQVIWCASWRL